MNEKTDPKGIKVMATDVKTRKSIANRLADGFKVVCSCTAETTVVHLSGPLQTKDELDALVEALAVMRDWLVGSEHPERTLSIMPSQRGGLARAAQKQSERTGA